MRSSFCGTVLLQMELCWNCAYHSEENISLIKTRYRKKQEADPRLVRVKFEFNSLIEFFVFFVLYLFWKLITLLALLGLLIIEILIYTPGAY